VVLLGAGATLAALPDGDRNGRNPPLIANFVSTLGLEPLLRAHGVRRVPDYFETWAGNGLRELLDAEVIDVRPEREVEETWRTFFHLSRHRQVCSSFYDSWLGRHPRRTCEAAFRRFQLAQRLERDAIPTGVGFDVLYRWLEPFLAVEREGRAPPPGGRAAASRPAGGRRAHAEARGAGA
jgi:hypothetical protein